MPASRILRSYLGRDDPPDQHTIGLYTGGRELEDAGYVRQVVRRGRWSIGRDGVARATVRFGPFVDSVSFDTTRLLADGEFVSEAWEGAISLRAGMSYEVQVEVEVT